MLPKRISSNSDVQSLSSTVNAIKDNNISAPSRTDSIEDSINGINSITPSSFKNKNYDKIDSSRVTRKEPEPAKPQNLSAKELKPTTENLKLAEEENMFGLTHKDRDIVRRSVADTPKKGKTLDLVVAKFTGNKATSFADLLANNRYNKDKNILTLFKTNLRKYSDDLLLVIKKILKSLWNLIATKARQFATNLKEKWESVKSSVIGGLQNLLTLEDKKTVTTGKNIGAGLITSIASLFLIMSGDKAHKKKVEKEGLLYKIKRKGSRVTKAIKEKLSIDTTGSDEDFDMGADVAHGDIKIDGSIVSKGIVKRVAVYKAFKEAGFGHGQALSLTGEVGRENSFKAKTLFGNHKDPASGHNIGFISWQGSRKNALVRRLAAAGVLKSKSPVQMDQTYASLLVMAKYVMYEMKSKSYTSDKKKHAMVDAFLAKPNITYNEASPLLGRGYIIWAYGQNTIKDPDRKGHRKAFNWKAHQNTARQHAAGTAAELNGKGDVDLTSIRAKTLELENRMEADFNRKRIASSNKGINVVSELSSTPIPKTVYASSLSPVQSSRKKSYAKQYHIDKQINTNMEQPRTNFQRAPVPSPETSHSSNVPQNQPIPTNSSAGRKLVPSLFEILIQKDITGNMF